MTEPPQRPHRHDCPSYGYYPNGTTGLDCICDDKVVYRCMCDDPEVNLMTGLMDKGLSQWDASRYVWGFDG